MLQKTTFLLGWISLIFITTQASNVESKVIATFINAKPTSSYGIAVENDELQLYINGKPYEKWSRLLPASTASDLWHNPFPTHDALRPRARARHSHTTKTNFATISESSEFRLVQEPTRNILKIVETTTTTVS